MNDNTAGRALVHYLCTLLCSGDSRWFSRLLCYICTISCIFRRLQHVWFQTAKNNRPYTSNSCGIKAEGFRRTRRLTLSIYKGAIQGHVNRLNHVQSVFVRPLPLLLSHTLSLFCTALPDCLLLPPLSLSLPVSSAHIYALLLFPSLSFSIYLYIISTLASLNAIGKKDAIFSHPLFFRLPFFLSLSLYCFCLFFLFNSISAHSPAPHIYCLFSFALLSLSIRLELAEHSGIISCFLLW